MSERASGDTYGRAGSDAEVQRLGEVLSECFGFPPADAAAWFARGGLDALRVVRRGAEVVGGLMLVPMGQHWGGRAVPTCGFAGVGIAPTARGGGTATLLMAGALRELRAGGTPLAALYPSTQPLYRRVGFEQAALRCEVRGPVRALPRGRRDLPVRTARAEDLPALQALYADVARTRQGWLARGPYVWSRVAQPRGLTARGYVVEGPGGPLGYCFVGHAPQAALHHDFVVSDLVARTPEALQRLLGFLGDHASVGLDVVWHEGPDAPALQLVEEQQSFAVRVVDTLLLRLLDVPAALAARGWPRGLSGALHLDVADALFPENAGRWVLEVAGGEARVRAGGDGALRTDVRALATLYAGLRSATALAGLGLLAGTPDALEAADALFVARTPGLPDMF